MVTANQLSYIEENTNPENLNFLGICLTKSCVKAKNEAKIIKAQAKADNKAKLAAQGIDTSFWGNFGKALPSILGGAASVFSAIKSGNGGSVLPAGQTGGVLSTGGIVPAGYSVDAQGNVIDAQGKIVEPASESDNTGLYIGLGVGGLVIVGLIVWAIAKKG